MDSLELEVFQPGLEHQRAHLLVVGGDLLLVDDALQSRVRIDLLLREGFVLLLTYSFELLPQLLAIVLFLLWNHGPIQPRTL